jgi:hypothetical protein
MIIDQSGKMNAEDDRCSKTCRIRHFLLQYDMRLSANQGLTGKENFQSSKSSMPRPRMKGMANHKKGQDEDDKAQNQNVHALLLAESDFHRLRRIEEIRRTLMPTTLNLSTNFGRTPPKMNLPLTLPVESIPLCWNEKIYPWKIFIREDVETFIGAFL